MLSSVCYADFFPRFFFFTQGYEWGRSYCQSQQPPSPDGNPQGFVRREYDGSAGYRIGEYVDGKRHGHSVVYGPAGDVLGEGDMLLGERQLYR